MTFKIPNLPQPSNVVILCGVQSDGQSVTPLLVDSTGTLDTNATFSGTITVGSVSIQDGTTSSQKLAVDASGNASVKLGTSIPSGSAIIGKVGIDQTSPGTTNAVQVTGTLPAFAAVPTVNVGSNVVSSFLREAGAAPTTAGNLGGHAATKGVIIKADDDNTNSVYVGESSSITADSGNSTSGFRLKAGQSIKLSVNNANLVYIIASTTGQNYVAIIE